MRLLIKIAFALLSSSSAWGQVTIKGVVYWKLYKRKELMPYVIVSESGNNANSVLTNSKGEFEITANAKKPTLIFTLNGYRTRNVKVGKKRKLEVSLKAEPPKKGTEVKIHNY